MIYEVRTYTLRPGTLAEFEERYAKRLPLREKHSKLGAFWHTEFGHSIRSSTSIPMTTCNIERGCAPLWRKTPSATQCPAAGNSSWRRKARS